MATTLEIQIILQLYYMVTQILTFLHIYVKTTTTMSTSHVIAEYVPQTNMPTKLGIHVKYLMGIYE